MVTRIKPDERRKLPKDMIIVEEPANDARTFVGLRGGNVTFGTLNKAEHDRQRSALLSERISFKTDIKEVPDEQVTFHTIQLKDPAQLEEAMIAFRWSGKVKEAVFEKRDQLATQEIISAVR